MAGKPDVGHSILSTPGERLPKRSAYSDGIPLGECNVGANTGALDSDMGAGLKDSLDSGSAGPHQTHFAVAPNMSACETKTDAIEHRTRWC